MALISFRIYTGKAGFLMTLVMLYIVALKSVYSTDNRSLYGHVVCCVPVSCKANGVGKELEAWRNSDLLAILYMYLSNCLEIIHTLKR